MSGSRWLFIAGLLLIASALALWAVGDFSLPARRPPTLIRFSGLSRTLAALAPALLGAALLVLWCGGQSHDGRLPQWLAAAAVAAAVLAFLLAERIH